MVGMLREIESTPRGASIQMDSKGEVEPLTIGSATI